jgi:DNA-binding transcriptional MerR regulator
MIKKKNNATAVKKGPPVKYFRIGEVVQYSGVSRQTIHNYTVMGLIREQLWTQGGHRLYGEDVFARLEEIMSMRRKSLSLAEIRKVLLAAG